MQSFRDEDDDPPHSHLLSDWIFQNQMLLLLGCAWNQCILCIDCCIKSAKIFQSHKKTKSQRPKPELGWGLLSLSRDLWQSAQGQLQQSTSTFIITMFHCTSTTEPASQTDCYIAGRSCLIEVISKYDLRQLFVMLGSSFCKQLSLVV